MLKLKKAITEIKNSVEGLNSQIDGTKQRNSELENRIIGSSHCGIMAQWQRIQLGTMRFRVQSLASLKGLRIQHCHELRCQLQPWLRFCVAVTVA